ncbi:MAG: group II intron maturase-specific domain-containing protein [Acidobacteriota bacterium]
MDHQKLLEKLNTSPTYRRQIKAWLKSGYMDGEKLFPTNEGTPQGGVASPLLANIALHGMEKFLKDCAPYIVDMRDKRGHQKARSTRTRSLNVIRYADDLIVLHEDRQVVEKCKEILEMWLKEIGLEFKESKTQIVHTLKKTNKESGFNFLGFQIRQFPVSKYETGHNPSGVRLGFKTIIEPSKEAIKRHHLNLKEVISKHKGKSQTELIQTLNPKIRGWCNYYRAVCSKESFYRLDMLMWQSLWAWAKRRHPNKGKYWVTNKYWKTAGND